MTVSITHAFVSGKAAGSDPTRVYGTHWDAAHTVPVATQAQAEAGTSEDVLMTPLAVAQYAEANTQTLDATLTSLADYNTNGLLTQTAADTFTGRTLTAPAAGVSVSNGDGVSGNPTLALANDLAALEGLASTGIAARTASDTWAQRTITGTASEITVADGDGVSGNPTISLHSGVYRSGGTDVALADGGTGASLADPNADRIMFWDDSAGAVTWLTAGTGLTITDTTIIPVAASEGASGIIELATTTEAKTRTDTSRAVTAAGLDAAIEAAPDLRRSRIVNGCMQISQRNGTTAGTSDGYWPVDRIEYKKSLGAGVISVKQDATASPDGSPFVIKATVTTDQASISASHYAEFRQTLEGSKVADFLFGTADAKAGVLRKWVYGPAGTYGAYISNASGARAFVGTFTISSAATWEKKEIAFTGDTTGTWPTGDVHGWTLGIVLVAGTDYHGSAGWQAASSNNKRTTSSQFNFLGTNGNVFMLGDVGLKMDVDGIGQYGAFEVPDVSQARRDCMRYFQSYGGNQNYERIAVGGCSSTTRGHFVKPLGVTMRTTPTISVSSAGHFGIYNAAEATSTVTSFATFGDETGVDVIGLYANVASGLTANSWAILLALNTTSARLYVSAEM